MSDEVQVSPGPEHSEDLDVELRSLVESRGTALAQISERGGGEDWDSPFDLRIARPRVTDLRAVWAATNTTAPVPLAGALGATRPVLITHTVTPFPVDGGAPARVWGLGYELVAHDVEAHTVAVAPATEVYNIANVGQTVMLGIDAGGAFGLALEPSTPSVGLRASLSQRFQFEVAMKISLRKVVGAPVGSGGAQWKMFRQNEPLDQPHVLLQLVLLPESALELPCTVKTWAKQAGRFGTSWGAKFWSYSDQTFSLKLI